MTTRKRRLWSPVTALILLGATLTASRALAQSPDALREAAKRFERGVTLYGEADYRGALVEFRRAGALVPNAAVLYNIGETEYQLKDYASALTTFERYLAEAGPGDSHRAEVESNVSALRSRVGHIAVTTVPPGAEISVDDQPVGRTPLEKSVLVSIGRRKVVASLAGRLPVTRYVDVAAEDNVSVALQLSAPTGATLEAWPAARSAPSAPTDSGRPLRGADLRIAGWVTAGALAAGAATFALLAFKESDDLQAERNMYPVANGTLDHMASVTTTYSILADAFGAGAIIVGGITLYSTLSSSSSSSSQTGRARIDVGLGSARFETTF